MIKARLPILIVMLLCVSPLRLPASFVGRTAEQWEQERKTISASSEGVLIQRFQDELPNFENQGILLLIIDELVSRGSNRALPVLKRIGGDPSVLRPLKAKAKFAAILIEHKDPQKRLEMAEDLLATDDQYLGNEVYLYLLQNVDDKTAEKILSKYKDENYGAKRGYLILKQKNLTDQQRARFLIGTLIQDIEHGRNFSPSYSQLIDVGRRRLSFMRPTSNTGAEAMKLVSSEALATIRDVEKIGLPTEKRSELIKYLALAVESIGDKESIEKLPSKAKEFIRLESEHRKSKLKRPEK